MLGMGLAVGGAGSAAFLAAVFVSHLPEAVGGGGPAGGGHGAAGDPGGLGRARPSSRRGGGAGLRPCLGPAGVDGTYMQAFAAGALLTMLADAVMRRRSAGGGR